MTYNITALQEATTVSKFMIYANDVSNGVLAGGFVLAVVFITLMATRTNRDFDEALFVSSFVGLVLSLLLNMAGMFIFYYTVIFLIVLGFTGLYIFVLKRE